MHTSTLKLIEYEMWLRQMGNNGNNGHMNSIEVAVFCLMQKIMNGDAWSSKRTKTDSLQGKETQVFARS